MTKLRNLETRERCQKTRRIFSHMKNFCFVKKSLLNRLINILSTKKVALIRDTFSRPFKSTKMSKFRYDYEIINCKSGIVLNILFERLLSKTTGKATILFFLKSTLFNTLDHQYLIRCFYGTYLRLKIINTPHKALTFNVYYFNSPNHM